MPHILIFHLWINISSSEIENFIKQISYIGVDIFFFLSGYSLYRSDTGNYFQFIGNRFRTVYSKFILFALIAAWVNKWNMGYVLKDTKRRESVSVVFAGDHAVLSDCSAL